MPASDPPTTSPQAPRGAERRRYTRAAVDWPVTIQLSDGHYGARLRDVSAAGLCFYMDRQVPEMTVLDVEVPVRVGEDERDIRCRGAVVRCRPISPSLDHYEVAVFLHDIGETDRAWLAAYVAQNEAAGASA